MAVMHAMFSSTVLTARQPPDKPSQTFPSKLAWSVELSADPSTVPLAAGDRIFVALESGTLAAHRLTDGVEIWSITRKADHPMSVVDGRVIVAGDGAVTAIATADGKEIWNVSIGKLTAPPLVRGGWVILAEEGKLSARRASDGAEIWQQDTGPVSQRPAIDGGRMFVPVQDGRL